ncbi:MAG: hypothetical protein ACREDH_09835 [Methylocella sp.]
MCITAEQAVHKELARRLISTCRNETDCCQTRDSRRTLATSARPIIANGAQVEHGGKGPAVRVEVAAGSGRKSVRNPDDKGTIKRR